MIKNIRSWFIIEEETPKKKKQPSSKNKPTPQKNKPTSKPTMPKLDNITSPPTPLIPDSDISSKEYDEKMLNILFQAMEKANLDGFDYLEYRKSLLSLVPMKLDTKTRYQSAYAMAQSMGGDVQVILDSALHYITALQNERNTFEKAVEAQSSTKVGTKKNELKHLEEVIAKKEAEIKKLTEQVAKHRDEITVIEKDLNEATTKINETKQKFVNAHEFLRQEIQIDMDNIKQFLK